VCICSMETNSSFLYYCNSISSCIQNNVTIENYIFNSVAYDFVSYGEYYSKFEGVAYQ
jgi:hypothetical protein